MGSMDRKQFLERFVFAVAEDFKDANGKPASWAQGHPKQWSEEDAVIEIPEVPNHEPYGYMTLNLAVTDDERLFAVSKGRMIFIYDVDTGALKSELKGHEANISSLAFQPTHLCGTCSDEKLAHDPDDLIKGGKPLTYTLISAAQDASGTNPALILWELFPTGHLVPNCLDEGPDVPSLATQAIESILPTLQNEHGYSLSDLSSLASKHLHPAFRSALSSSLAAHALQSNQSVLTGATLPIFTPTSALFHPTLADHSLYLTHNSSTQRGPRPPDSLPHVQIYSSNPSSPSLVSSSSALPPKVMETLSGHTDLITWAGFSPLTGRYLATASWDGSMSVYDLVDQSAETGHSFSTGLIRDPTRNNRSGQAWCAAFSTDEKYVAVSGASGHVLMVYDVTGGNGEEVAMFPPAPDEKEQQLSGGTHGSWEEQKAKVTRWIRTMAWSPSPPLPPLSLEKRERTTLLFATGIEAYLWDPFVKKSMAENKEHKAVMLHYRLDVEDRLIKLYAEISQVIHNRLSVIEAEKKEAPRQLDNPENTVFDGTGKGVQAADESYPNRQLPREREIITILCADGTFECWDPEQNVKWRFARPQGKVMDWSNGGVIFLNGGRKGGRTQSAGLRVVSLDGDARLRIWKL